MKTTLKMLYAAAALAASTNAAADGCTVSSGPVAFGNYPPTSATPTDITATLSVTCQYTVSLLISYTVSLSAGNYGTMATRKMASGANRLNYQLYFNSTRTTIWGDGTSSSVYLLDGYLLQVVTPIVLNYTIYGRIPALQNVYAGTYGDTVVATLTF